MGDLQENIARRPFAAPAAATGGHRPAAVIPRSGNWMYPPHCRHPAQRQLDVSAPLPSSRAQARDPLGRRTFVPHTKSSLAAEWIPRRRAGWGRWREEAEGEAIATPTSIYDNFKKTLAGIRRVCYKKNAYSISLSFT
jgi:hypothetical protein